jgi:hypothetical protein
MFYKMYMIFFVVLMYYFIVLLFLFIYYYLDFLYIVTYQNLHHVLNHIIYLIFIDFVMLVNIVMMGYCM